MTKNEYLQTLGAALRKNHVADADDVIGEYEQHFNFKIADGYTEEEIAAKLEKPEAIAAHYIGSTGNAAATGKTLIKIAMGILAVFEYMIYAIFFAWVIAMAVATVAFAGVSVCLICNIFINSVAPTPYVIAVLLGIGFAALALIFACFTYLCFEFFKQIIKASIRWHAIVTGESALPPLTWTPQFEPVTNRRIRNLLLWPLIILAVFFIVAYVASSAMAGSLEFWHVWGWFV